MRLLTRNLFVRNDNNIPTVEAAKSIQNLTANVLPKLVRHDSMEGRDYLVVPMVILTEGVHNGSEGPLYYPPEELSKTPVAWNAKPLVIYHPQVNGQAISACDPAVFTTRKVGLMMNTRYEGGRLKSEAWIEEDRAKTVDNRVLEAIQNSTILEVSTGVFIDAEHKPGEWNGEQYKGIARNFRPDHLAILPDKIGACSIADGAGFLRNEKNKGKTSPKLNPVKRLLDVAMMKMGFSANALSNSNIEQLLQVALREKLGISDEYYNGPYAWICDVFSNFFVYDYDGALYMLTYSVSADDKVTIDEGEPVEVQRQTQYRKKADGVMVNTDSAPQISTNAENTMNKKVFITNLIALSAGLFSETDRPRFEKLSEKELQRISFVKEDGTSVAPTDNEKETSRIITANQTSAQGTPAPVANQNPGNVVQMPPQTSAGTAAAATSAGAKVVTMQEYIAAAPKEVAQVLQNSLDVYNEEKKKLVDSIMAVKNHSFTAEDLNNRPLGELRNLCALAGAILPQSQASSTVPNYAGQQQTTNAAAEEALPLPTMNFEKKAAGAK